MDLESYEEPRCAICRGMCRERSTILQSKQNLNLASDLECRVACLPRTRIAVPYGHFEHMTYLCVALFNVHQRLVAIGLPGLNSCGLSSSAINKISTTYGHPLCITQRPVRYVQKGLLLTLRKYIPLQNSSLHTRRYHSHRVGHSEGKAAYGNIPLQATNISPGKDIRTQQDGQKCVICAEECIVRPQEPVTSCFTI